MNLIDTHCHIDAGEFEADRLEILKRCGELGIERIVVPAVTAAGWDGLLALCGREKGLLPALGLHPMYLEQHQPGDLNDLGERLAGAGPVAVGEIGLDYHVQDLDRERQRALFDAQLTLARDAGLPVLLHVRKAHDPVLECLRRIRVPGGIVHAFNGSLQQAQRYLDLGFVLGFGGTVTYPQSRRIRELARALPLEALVLETDAPDMVVAAHHGERNSPEYLVDVLAALAELRDEPAPAIARQTTLNAVRILRLAPPAGAG